MQINILNVKSLNTDLASGLPVQLKVILLWDKDRHFDSYIH